MAKDVFCLVQFDGLLDSLVLEHPRIAQHGVGNAVPALGDDRVVVLPRVGEQEPDRWAVAFPVVACRGDDLRSLVVDDELPPVHLCEAVDVHEVSPCAIDLGPEEGVHLLPFRLKDVLVEVVGTDGGVEVVAALLPDHGALEDAAVDQHRGRGVQAVAILLGPNHSHALLQKDALDLLLLQVDLGLLQERRLHGLLQ